MQTRRVQWGRKHCSLFSSPLPLSRYTQLLFHSQGLGWVRLACWDSSHLAVWICVGPGKYWKGRSWIDGASGGTDLFSRGGFGDSCVSPCLLQLPPPRLMHLVLSPGIEPAPAEWLYWTCTCSLFAHIWLTRSKHRALRPQPLGYRHSPSRQSSRLASQWAFSLLCPFSGLTLQPLTLLSQVGAASSPAQFPTARKRFQQFLCIPKPHCGGPGSPSPGETVGTHMNKVALSKEPSSPGPVPMLLVPFCLLVAGSVCTEQHPAIPHRHCSWLLH